MKKTLFIILIFLLLPFLAKASSTPIISGISKNEIKIDSKFNGEKILLFGAKNDSGNIIAVVRGPKHDFLLNKKEKFFGIWHNGNQVKFHDAYSFYNLFSDFLGKELNQQSLVDFEIGKQNLPLHTSEKTSNNIIDRKFFDLMEKQNLYSSSTDSIVFLDDTLFSLAINFPANILEGVYNIEIYLVENDSVISFQSIPIYVNKVGFSSEMAQFAKNQRVVYGLSSIIIAILVGFFINYIFNRFSK
jgi:uncharacterized protein (TIGR02186 family)